MLKGKRVFVLGSGSFSGSHFVDHCLTLGGQVVGTNRSPESAPVFLPYLRNSSRNNFKFVQAHLNTDLEKIVKEIKDFQPEFIVDFAGQGMVAPSWKTPELWYETNLVSKVKLHNHLREFKFIKAYLRFSTPEVYGSTNGIVDEEAPLKPSTPYAVSHAAIDMSVMSFYRYYGFPAIITRTTNVYGPGQQLYRIVPKSILCAKSGKKLTLDGGGTSQRDFIYIGDVNKALISLLLKRESVGQIYHLSGDFCLPIREVVEKVATLVGVPFKNFVTVGEERPAKDHSYKIGSTKIQNQTGWKAQVSLESGLKHVANWIDENRGELDNYSWDYIHKV
jgi:dTDP-glucose 4,6-dehydratase